MCLISPALSQEWRDASQYVRSDRYQNSPRSQGESDRIVAVRRTDFRVSFAIICR